MGDLLDPDPRGKTQMKPTELDQQSKDFCKILKSVVVGLDPTPHCNASGSETLIQNMCSILKKETTGNIDVAELGFAPRCANLEQQTMKKKNRIPCRRY